MNGLHLYVPKAVIHIVGLLAVVCLSISCRTIEGLDGERLGRETGRRVGLQQARNLDDDLQGPMKVKRSMEHTARLFRRDFADNPEIRAAAQEKYQSASNALVSLRDSVKTDIQRGGKQASQETEDELENLEAEAKALSVYYEQESGRSNKSGLIAVVAIADQVFRAWDAYDQARKQEVMKGVDQRLTPRAWATL